jgi:hypothetical protein
MQSLCGNATIPRTERIVPQPENEVRYWAFTDAPTRNFDTAEVLYQLKFLIVAWDTRWAQNMLALGTTFSPDLGWDTGAMREFRKLVNSTFGVCLPASPDLLKATQKLSDYRNLINMALTGLGRLS